MAFNPAINKLVSAGVSPSNAALFTRKYVDSKVPAIARPRDTSGTEQTGGPNPTTPPRVEPIISPGVRLGATAEIAFDAQIMAIAQAKNPLSYRAPVTESPEIEKYLIGTQGTKINDQLRRKAFVEFAPDLLKIRETFPTGKALDPLKYTFTQLAYAWLDNDMPLQVAIEKIAARAVTGPGAFGGMDIEGATKLVTSMWGQDEAARKAYYKNVEGVLATDKYYQASLPPPGYKYGATTSHTLKTIDVRTIPGIKEWLDKQNETAKILFPGASQAGGIAIDRALKNLGIRSAKPFDDEVIRRQDLYKAAIVSP